VPRSWISPDGRRYAYPEYRSAIGPVTGVIHVVDVAGGADRAFSVPAPSMPISFEADGVYIARVIPNSDAAPIGLSLLDPGTGALRQLASQGAWTLISGRTAYGGTLDTSLPMPGHAGGPGQANRLLSLNLDTGAVTAVRAFPGELVQLFAVAGSDLVLGVSSGDRFAIQAGTATLYQGPALGGERPGGPPHPAPPVVVDGDTIWFSGAGAVWRSVGRAPATSIPVPLQYAQVAGTCR